MPRSSLEKLWLSGGALIALVMLLVGYFMFIGPQRSQTDEVNAQQADANAQITRLQHKIDTLQAQNKNLAQYQAAAQQAQLALPSTSGLPDLLRTLQAIGNSTLATVSALTVGAPADVTAPAARTASPAPSAGAGSGATPEPQPSALRVYSLPITAQIEGSPAQLGQFLTQLQAAQPRAVLISQLTQSTATTARGSGPSTATTLHLTMRAFVAPSSPAERAQLAAAAGR